MSVDPRAHVFYRIANAPVLTYPFPHFYLESVFPDDYYRQLLDALPPLAAYTPLAATGTVLPGSYPERFSLHPGQYGSADPPPPQSAFWLELMRWVGSHEFSNLLVQKFGSTITARFGAGNEFRVSQDARLMRDLTNYALGPHTDTPRKLVSLLFYLPRDEKLRHLGTSIFEPVDPDFTCDGTQHHDFAGFRMVYTAPFRPNSLFAFCKTDKAFHGVLPVGDANIERDVLQYNIYLDEILTSKPPPPGPRWPWSNLHKNTN
jgi:hypothetical protein